MQGFSKQRPPGEGYPSEAAIEAAFREQAKRDIMRIEERTDVASEGFWTLAAMLRDEQKINNALVNGAKRGKKK